MTIHLTGIIQEAGRIANLLTLIKNPGKMNSMNFDRRLLRLAASSRSFLLLAVIAGFIAGLAAVLQARQLSRVISRVFVDGQSLNDVMPILWFFLLIVAVRAIVGFVSEATASRAAIQVKENLRALLSRQIVDLGPVYVQGERSGELVNTASQGIEAVDAYFSQFLPQLALAGMLPLAYLAIIFPSDPLTGYVLLFTGPLIPVFMYLIGHNAEALTRRQWTALGRMSAYFLDTLRGLVTLKALGRSADQVERIAQVSERYRHTTLSVMRVTFLSAFALELLGTIGPAIVAVQIGLRLLYGRIGFEQAFFILLLAPEFYLPLRALGMRFHASMAGITAARNIFSVLEKPVLPIQNSGAKGPTVLLKEPFQIIFENVSYTYPGREQPALNEVSLFIHSGETIAVSGSTGAGKSTLAYLLLRFAQPDRGKILVNRIPLANLPIDQWRKQIAWVPQQPSIFYGTIAENLRLAKPSASMREIRSAAESACLLEFIDGLPQSFDTPVGEGGARLSAGQVQRLALARAFLRDAQFLILDEPTAHLDVEQEELLQKSTRKLCQNKTVFVIAHRLPTILQADHAFILDQGRIVESGPPGVLVRQGGVFSEMVSSYLGTGTQSDG